MNIFCKNKREWRIGFSEIRDRDRYRYEMEDYRRFLWNMGRIDSETDEEYYDFYIDLLKKELRYSSLLEINRGNIKDRYIYPFYKMSGDLIGYKGGRRKIEIDIRDNNLISQPWNHSRYSNGLRHLKNTEFRYDRSNHFAIYYDGLDIACAYNGLHSLGLGVYLGEGKIEAEYYDVRKIFKYVNTNEDLSFGYNKEKISERIESEKIYIPETLKNMLNDRFYGTDYRLLLIYELSKRKYESRDNK